MPISNLSSSFGELGAQQIAGPYGSILGPGATFPNSYDFAKTFVSVSNTTNRNGNGVTNIDDPTYLGFSLQFIQNSPLFNGVAGSASGESAVGYLERVGQATRANYLRGFINGIQSINRERPYYWQTVDGLSDAYNSTFNIEDPFSGSTADGGITIGCLEAIDLKISALFSLYKLACYDVKYKRYILPENLMNFEVYVSIQEIRKFKTVRNYIRSLNVNNPETETKSIVNENTSQITFKFSDCKWIPEESGKVFDSVTNAGGNEVTTSSMKWSYGAIEMEGQFSGFDSKLIDSAKQQPNSTGGDFNNTITKFGKEAAVDKANGAIDLAQRSGASLLQRLSFGNAFGFVNNAINSIQNQQGLISAIQGAALQDRTNNSTNSIGGNPLGESVQPSNSLPAEKLFTQPMDSSSLVSSKVFSSSPSGPPLKSTNIFK